MKIELEGSYEGLCQVVAAVEEKYIELYEAWQVLPTGSAEEERALRLLTGFAGTMSILKGNVAREIGKDSDK